MLGVNRLAPMRINFADHGSRDGANPIDWARTLLRRHGIEAEGEIVLQTMPRIMGYVFNPVSFMFCHDAQSHLVAVLCEVNNTFGERHNYIVAHADGRPIGPRDSLWARKVFHVSPFFPVRGEYRFRFVRRGAVRAVAIDYFDGGQLMLTTRLAGRAHDRRRRGTQMDSHSPRRSLPLAGSGFPSPRTRRAIGTAGSGRPLELRRG